MRDRQSRKRCLRRFQREAFAIDHFAVFHDRPVIVADVALAALRSGILEIAGLEQAPFNEIITRYLKVVGDPREGGSDREARYWGDRVEERSLVPLGEARLAASVSTNGSAAHGQESDPQQQTEG